MDNLEFSIIEIFSEGKKLTENDVWEIIKQNATLRTNSAQVNSIVLRFAIKDDYLKKLDSPMLPPAVYEIKPKGIQAYLHYKKLREKESEEQALQSKKLKYDVKNSERVYKTYGTTRAITWITFFVTLVLALLKLAETLHIWPYHK